MLRSVLVAVVHSDAADFATDGERVEQMQSLAKGAQSANRPANLTVFKSVSTPLRDSWCRSHHRLTCRASLFSTFSYIYKEGGVKALYRGVRSVPLSWFGLVVLSADTDAADWTSALESVWVSGKRCVQSLVAVLKSNETDLEMFLLQVCMVSFAD